MQLHNKNLTPAEVAQHVLRLALAGRDLELGTTARTRLMAFTMAHSDEHDLDAAYRAVADLLDREDVRASILADNTAEATASVPTPTKPKTATLTELMSAAVAGDAEARAELDRRGGVIR